MNKGQKKQPVYLEANPCPKCGSTKKIQVERKGLNRRIILYIIQM